MSSPFASSTTASTQAPAKPAYGVRLARSAADVRAAQALRFEIFNVEMNEGLVQSYDTGLDADPFDAVCDHLLVHDSNDGTLVGTYRLQTGTRAKAGLGYYSEREFDFAPFEAMRAQILELGRACIHLKHRNFAVLTLLWKGIGSYAQEQSVRYLIGCSSITSQDAADGAAVYQALAAQRAPQAWQTLPQPAFACPLHTLAVPAPRIPRLLSAYLSMGAAICAPPAIDREFRSIDFLTWADVHSPAVQAMQARGRFVV